MVALKRQTGRPCCSANCRWMVVNYRVHGPTTETEHWDTDKLTLTDGAVYVPQAGEDLESGYVDLPIGGGIRSVKKHPFVNHALVGFMVRIPDAEFTLAPYGTSDYRFRVFFESDDAEANYVFADVYMESVVIQLANGSEQVENTWKAKLGKRVAGVDSYLRYEYLLWQDPNDNDGIDYRDYWFILTRETCFAVEGGGTEPAGCKSVYQFYIDLPPLNTSSVPLNPLRGLGGPLSGSSDGLDRGVAAPSGDTDPVDTHFGIVRLGSSTDKDIQVKVAIAGQTSVVDDVSTSANECFYDMIVKTAPCVEESPVLLDYEIDDTYPGTYSQADNFNGYKKQQLGGAIKYQSQADEHIATKTWYYDAGFGPIAQTTKWSWTHWEFITVDDVDEQRSQGDTPARVLLRVTCVETTHPYTDPLNVTGRYSYDWEVYIPAASYGLTCDGLEILLDVADATITETTTLRARQLNSMRITLST